MEPRFGGQSFERFGRGFNLKILWVAVIVILFLLMGPWVIVSPGHRGVLVRLGAVQKGVLGEGLHFRIPLMDGVVKLNVQVQKNEAKAVAASKDLQTVSSVIATNYHLVPETVDSLYQNIGYAYESKIIEPAVQEVVKAVTAKFTAEELITKRSDVKNAIKTQLAEWLKAFDIKVVEVAVSDFDFSRSFNEAIEAKQVAEQNVAKARNELESIKVEAEQKITKAKAEAESLKIQREQITENLLKLREIENQRLALEKWDGKLPSVTGGTIPFIQVK